MLSDAYWEETVGVLLDAAAEVHAALGIEFEFVNVGGGLGIPYRPGQAPVDVPGLARRLAAVWDARLKGSGAVLPRVPALYMENVSRRVGRAARVCGWEVGTATPHRACFVCYLVSEDAHRDAVATRHARRRPTYEDLATRPRRPRDKRPLPSGTVVSVMLAPFPHSPLVRPIGAHYVSIPVSSLALVFFFNLSSPPVPTAHRPSRSSPTSP